jgi:ectoine hydroxylase-related dioxygenase (phytanoyl-CoA dioxygenase family)
MAAISRTLPVRAAFIEAGYFVERGFISSAHAAQLRAAAARLLAAPSALHTSTSVRSFELHKHEPAFARLLEDDYLRALVRELLGPKALLSDLSLNEVRRNQQADVWHIDYPYNEMPAIPVGGVLALQCVLALSPFTASTGATQLIPGSNRRYRKPPAQVDDEPLDFLAEPGDLLVVSAALWHRAQVNHETEPRTAVLLNFTENWVRPLFPPTESSAWQPL